MTEIVNEGWQLQSLQISRSWSNTSATYIGKIRFKNGKEDDLGFSIPPEKMEQMLSLISDCVVNSARELGQGLVASVRPAELPPTHPEKSRK